MELKEFVSQTLVQIVQGVTEAQQALSESQPDSLAPAIFSPEVQSNYDWAAQHGYLNTEHGLAQIVAFDIALGASSGTEGGAKAGIAVGPIHIGASGTKSEDDTSLSRVRFSVPLILPTHKE